MITVHWFKCGDEGRYCDFEKLNLDTVTEVGVYIIWHVGSGQTPARVVRI